MTLYGLPMLATKVHQICQSCMSQNLQLLLHAVLHAGKVFEGKTLLESLPRPLETQT